MRATRSMHIALFGLAASVLMLEVTVTRLFSVMLWSHYTFLVISTALLGFGAAGTFLFLKTFPSDDASVRTFLSRACLAFAVATALCVGAVTLLGFEPTKIFVDASNTVKLLAIYVLVATPFFFAGLAICRLLAACAAQIHTLYFADLIGAGAGALGVTLLLRWIGAPAALLTCCALATLAGSLFGTSRVRWSSAAACAGFASIAAVVFVYDPWPIPPSPLKPLVRNRDAEVEYSRWTLHARIDVVASQKRSLDFGEGVARPFLERKVDYRPFYMDGSNPSRMIRHGQSDWFIPRLLSAAPYALGFSQPRVLVIGSGGGIDTLVARHHGASHVTAVEINPETIDLVRGEFADYIGHLFSQPGVELFAAEGRHFLTLDHDTYDVVRLTGVDTRASGVAGANSLDQAYLYTTEAIRDLIRHLTPDGVLAITRPHGWQVPRLVRVIVASLREDGVEDAASRLAVVTNQRWCDVLLRQRPYNSEEIAALERWATRVRMRLVYDPFTHRDTATDQILRDASGEALRDARRVTDDSPFFFERQTLGEVVENLTALRIEHSRHSGYLILIITLLQGLILSFLLVLLPAARARVVRESASRAWAFVYFSLLGMGFILIELVFIQKYMIVLGGPAYAMSVTLFSVLIFSGLGAGMARRIGSASRSAPHLAFAGLLLLLGATIVFIERGLPQLLGLGFGGRVAASVASIAPLSFALGWPFPLGIRVLDRDAPELVPWAWASNACFTVIGSVLSVILSMSWGFAATLKVAAVCYAGAALALHLLGRVRASG